MNQMTNGATIIIENTGESFHTLRDWGLAMGNTDYIGEPEFEEYLVDIPGREGLLDLTDTIAGRPIYKSRPITVSLGGKRNRYDWDSIISDLRIKIHGKRVKLIFDNDRHHYWIGRAKIQDFERTREIGTFTLSIPKADAYKYNTRDSLQEWLWDGLNFYNGIIDKSGVLSINGTVEYTIHPENMPIVPIIFVESMGAAGVKVAVDEVIHTLVKGRNRFADLIIIDSKKILKFTGNGEIKVQYRRGGL